MAVRPVTVVGLVPRLAPSSVVNVIVPETDSAALGVVVPMPTRLLVESMLTIEVVPSALVICSAVVEFAVG